MSFLPEVRISGMDVVSRSHSEQIVARIDPLSPGFRYPDSDEDDSDEEVCNKSQDDDMTPVESPFSTKSKLPEAIDLTKDEGEAVPELPKAARTASTDDIAFKRTGSYMAVLSAETAQAI